MIGTPPPPEKSQKYRVLAILATKSAFNVGPSSTRQGNAIEMAFRWRADDGPFIVVFVSYSYQLKKKLKQNWTPSEKTF